MLTNDVDLIVRILSKSTNVVVDTSRMTIKPNWKLQRNTIILRDIPSDAPADEVKLLFADKFPISNIHSDVGDTWFVSFETEDHALDALLHVRDLSFRDKPVKARMKAEHLLKSSGVTQQPYAPSYPVDPAYAYRAYAPQYARAYAGGPSYWEGQDGGKDRRPFRAGGGGGGGGAPRRNPTQPPTLTQQPHVVAAPHAQPQLQAHQTHANPHPTHPQQHGRPRGNSHGQGQAPYKGVQPHDAQNIAGVVAPGAPVAADAKKSRPARKGKKHLEAKPLASNGIHPTPTGMFEWNVHTHTP